MEKRAQLTLTLKAWRGPPRSVFSWKLYSRHKLIAESTILYQTTARLRQAVWNIFGVGIGNPEDNTNITVVESPGFPKPRKRKNK